MARRHDLFNGYNNLLNPLMKARHSKTTADTISFQNECGGLSTVTGLTSLEETHAYFNGGKVASGVLAGVQLTDTTPEESAVVFSFCEDVGLPTTLADIGLQDFDQEMKFQFERIPLCTESSDWCALY